MFVSCWSVKGGSGTTVVAVSLALMLAKSAPEGVLLVDLGGDVPAVLGMSEPSGPGVAEWLAAGADVPVEGWARLEVAATSSVCVVPRGVGPLSSPDRVDVLVGLLANEHRPVVIDCGVVGAAARTDAEAFPRVRRVGHALADGGAQLLPRDAPRPALAGAPVGRRAAARGGSLVRRGERRRHPRGAGDRRDRVRSRIGRAVDAGLLAGRLPRGLERALQHAA